MTDELDDDEYIEMMERINARVEEAFPSGLVTFSAFDHDEHDLPVDNLDHVAIEGFCILAMKNNPFFGEGQDYKSEVLEDPTWWTILKHANEMVEVTGDEHHVFLEGVARVDEQIGGVECYRFVMGS